MSDAWRGAVANAERAAAVGLGALHDVVHVARSGDPDPVTGIQPETETDIRATVEDNPRVDVDTRGDEPEPNTIIQTFSRRPIIRSGDVMRFQSEDRRVIEVQGALVVGGADGERWSYRCRCGVR